MAAPQAAVKELLALPTKAPLLEPSFAPDGMDTLRTNGSTHRCTSPPEHDLGGASQLV